MVVTDNGWNNHKLGYFHCTLDFWGCVHRDVSAAQGANRCVAGLVRVAIVLVADNHLVGTQWSQAELDGGLLRGEDSSGHRGCLDG